MFDSGQDFIRHFAHDLIGISVWHESRHGASASHPETSGIVDHDEIDAAGFFTLRADASAGTSADDRQAIGDLPVNSLQDFLTGLSQCCVSTE